MPDTQVRTTASLGRIRNASAPRRVVRAEPRLHGSPPDGFGTSNRNPHALPSRGAQAVPPSNGYTITVNTTEAPPKADFAPWPHHEPDELEAAHRVLASGKTNYWTGTEGREFEREYAAYLGREHAVALHNGSQALELALIALGVGPGDEVITTPAPSSPRSPPP